jgi:hypothetical protein
MWVSRENGRPSRAGGGAVFEAFLERFAPQPGALDQADPVDADSVAPEPAGDSLF